jgi:hypothetical protein
MTVPATSLFFRLDYYFRLSLGLLHKVVRWQQGLPSSAPTLPVVSCDLSTLMVRLIPRTLALIGNAGTTPATIMLMNVNLNSDKSDAAMCW